MKPGYLIILAMLSLFSQLLKAQDNEKPLPPEVQRVYVDTATGLAVLEWLPSVSPDVSRYSLHYDTIDELGQQYWLQVPGFADSNQTTASIPSVNTSSSAKTLTVVAIDTANNPSNFPDGHRTMHLKTEYDSCEQSMTLNWTPYIGWGTNLVRYEVYLSVDRGAYDTLTATQDTSEIHINIVPNQSYCYFIKAYKNDASYSFSNIVCMNISHPVHPSWINAESASAIGGDQVEIRFAMDPAGEVRDFQLFKNSGPGKPFVADVIFRDVVDSLHHVDQVLSTSSRYQYKLRSLDICDAPVTTSTIAGNIVLSASSTGLESYLQWHPYVEFYAGVFQYRIYRSINRAPFELLPVAWFDTTYVDDLSGQEPGSIEDAICYYIEAEENNNWTRGVRGYSRSNIACVTIIPEIIMANAIIPNAAINNEIKPMLSFLPLKYIFAVYDRWGNRIFETREHDIPWDGRNKAGDFVPEGAYAYYIQLTTSNGIEVEDKGVITVVYK